MMVIVVDDAQRYQKRLAPWKHCKSGFGSVSIGKAGRASFEVSWSPGFSRLAISQASAPAAKAWTPTSVCPPERKCQLADWRNADSEKD